MKISAEQYERLCQFLDADMDATQMEAFETELLANPALRQQLQYELSVRQTFEKALGNPHSTQPAVEVPNFMAASHQPKVLFNIASYPGVTTPTENEPILTIQPNKPRRQWPYYLAAACTIAAIIATLFFITKKQKDLPIVKNNPAPTHKDTSPIAPPTIATVSPNTDSLFKKYLVKDTLPTTYPTYLAEAFAQYANGQYPATIQNLNFALIQNLRGLNEEKNTILQQAHYYKAMAYLLTNDAAKALPLLQWVINNPPTLALKNKANWYLALTYLKQNKTTQAVEILQKISLSPNPYQQKANNLIKAILGK